MFHIYIVHGGWSAWSAWGSCSTTCDTGQQQSTRSCTNPSPQYGGNTCPNVGSVMQSCMIKNCASMYILRHFFIFLSQVCNSGSIRFLYCFQEIITSCHNNNIVERCNWVKDFLFLKFECDLQYISPG